MHWTAHISRDLFEHDYDVDPAFPSVTAARQAREAFILQLLRSSYDVTLSEPTPLLIEKRALRLTPHLALFSEKSR